MQQFQNILVGIDLSHGDRLATSELNLPTQIAIRRAIWLAEHSSAELTFFAALDISAHTEEILADEFDAVTHSVKSDAKQVLDELVAQAVEKGVSAKSELVIGEPWKEIIHSVIDKKHDLVIVGTANRGTVSRFFFGSTGMKLLRNCPCPVWVSRPDPNIKDLNILVASELSDDSLDLLHLAVNAGQLAECQIHLVHALEDTMSHRLWLRSLPDEKVQEFHQQKQNEIEQALQEQLSQTDHRTLQNPVNVHVKEGPADVVILDLIEELGIDLLMMGTVARSGISGLILGNTAERLLGHVSCSVLAVKPKDFECPIRFD